MRSQTEAQGLATFTVTSCFSGLGTAELCARALDAEWIRRGLPLRCVLGMGFERYAIARSVFRRVSRGAPCGGDLLGLWPPEVGVRLQRPFDSYDALCHYLDQHSGELASTFIGPDTGIREHINLGDLHCGGNPCTDWSFMGQRRGLTGPPHLYWSLGASSLDATRHRSSSRRMWSPFPRSCSSTSWGQITQWRSCMSIPGSEGGQLRGAASTLCSHTAGPSCKLS